MSDSVRPARKFKYARLVAQLILALLLVGLWICIKQMDSPWEGRFRRLLREHKGLKFDDLIHVQLWWAAYIDRFIVGGLLLLSPLWLHWSDRDSPSHRVAPRSRRWLWLLGIMALAFGLRAARMDRGLERDEQDTVRRDILGFYITNDDGTEDYRLPPWSETMWEDSQANNPFLFSITARAALTVWQDMNGKSPAQVNRTVLRLPALIPGLISLVALWWWLRMMGLTFGADVALLLGALHPMHVDYSTQARGYALVMMFTALALGFAWLSLTEGRWRYWAALAGCFLGSLVANPGSIYFCGSLGICIGVSLLLRIVRKQDPNARADLVRFIICNVVSAAIYIPLVLPALPQALGYLKTFNGALDGPWPLQTLSKYFTGVMMPAPPDEYTARSDELSTWAYFLRDYVQSERLLLFLVFAFVPTLIAIGTSQVIKAGPEAIPLVIAGVGAPLVAYVYHRPEGTQFIYYWYLIYALPVILALVAAGLSRCGDFLKRRFTHDGAKWLPTVAFVAILGIANAPGPGRMLWFPGSQISDEIYERGKFLWITGPDGRTKRVPKVVP